MLANLVTQPSAHLDMRINLLPAVFEFTPAIRESAKYGIARSADIPPLLRPEALSPVVLRI